MILLGLWCCFCGKVRELCIFWWLLDIVHPALLFRPTTDIQEVAVMTTMAQTANFSP
jgi:hypothetical protein